MRKFISIMLITVLMLSCLAMTASATEYKSGDKVTIAFTSKDTGYACYDAVINYDKDALTLDAINSGSIYPDGSSFYGYTGTGKVTFAALDNVTTGGTLFTATFVVTDKAVKGQTYRVSAAVVPGTVADENDVDASLSISGGSITIYKAPCKHEHTETINKKDATCREAGYTGDTYCNDCQTTIEWGTEIPATGIHTWGGWVSTTPATCGKDGLQTRTCSVCGDTEAVPIPATGDHKHTEVRNAKAATCTEEGYTGDTYCTDCGNRIKEGTVIGVTVHTWDAGKVTKAPTCIDQGEMAYTCHCGATRTEPIAATGHDYGEDGHCKNCTAVKSDDSVAPVGPSAPSTPSEPSEPVTPTVKLPFTDVKENDWFYDEVLYVYEKGLMNGTGNGLFSPNANTTRGMIVTILARMEGVDTSKSSPWYAVGRQWAMENDISDGTNMEAEITREQLATMLYRYAKLKGYDITAKADLSAFADASTISVWAEEAMQWAVSTGLIQGRSGNLLAPQSNASRAEVATVLTRFCQLFAD